MGPYAQANLPPCCPECGGRMTFLFLSVVCEHCESPKTSPSGDYGYIVWRSRPPGSCEYVFKTEKDATTWRAAAGLDRFPIRKVFAKNGFRWRPSTGSVANITLADRLFEIYPDADKVEWSGSKAALVEE